MSVLQVKNLTTRIKTANLTFTVVDNVSFDLASGKTLALVGESGCGKTMTALSIMRILSQPPVLDPEGEVLYEGKNLMNLSEKEMRKIRGKKIAMIFQDPMSSLNPVYTVGDQLIEMAELHLDLYGEEGYEKVIQALCEVEIPEPETRFFSYPHQLSGGMKQRIMIAMAMLCEPDVLIADEPTTALYVTIQSQSLNLMKQLQEKKGTAILLITHDLGVVAEIADEVIVMYASKMIEKGSVLDIFDKRAHPYSQGLFKSMPVFDGEKGRLHAIEGSVPPLTQLPGGCSFNPRCPYAMEVCRKGEVPKFSIEKEQHWAKCWLYEKGKGK